MSLNDQQGNEDDLKESSHDQFTTYDSVIVRKVQTEVAKGVCLFVGKLVLQNKLTFLLVK